MAWAALPLPSGYMPPGLGIEINEELAAKFPYRDYVEQWTQTRLPDGTPVRP